MKSLVTKYYQKIFLPLLADTNTLRLTIIILKIVCTCSAANKDERVIEAALKKMSLVLAEKTNHNDLLKDERKLLMSLLNVLNGICEHVVKADRLR